MTAPSVSCLTPRQAIWLVLRQPAHLTTEDNAWLERLRQAHPAFAQAMALAQGFAQLLRARQPDRLDPWLQQAATSTLSAFRRLAKSFQRDYAALKAGITGPWSSGPVEGHINRLKMLKRQMFGRAHLDLLGHRFLRTPRERATQRVGPQAQAQATAQDPLSTHPTSGAVS